MRTEIECLKVIYQLLESSKQRNLDNVFFRHLRNVVVYMRLVVNSSDLNVSFMRVRLKKS